jgi:hypothetical protein
MGLVKKKGKPASAALVETSQAGTARVPVLFVNSQGTCIPCFATAIKEFETTRAMLVTQAMPDVHFESWVRYSKKKEPGTWHYA